MLATIAAIAAATLAAPPAVSADPVPPPIVGKTLVPPPVAEQAPRAVAVFAPYRYDDLLYENDRIAHRIYGHALEAFEPPSSSGIDAWGKSARWPFMERQLATGDQHGYHGDGIDFYNVDTARGAGGLGIWSDNKLWVSRNFIRHRILQNGPDAARFEVDYAPWPVGVGRSVSETRRFTLPLGSNFTRMVSTISSDRSEPLVVGIGISKRPTAARAGTFVADRAAGVFIWWGPTDPVKGTMAVALRVDPAQIADVREDFDNYLVLLKVTPGKPFVYYSGAAWDKGRDFHTREEWEAYARAYKGDFDPAR